MRGFWLVFVDTADVGARVCSRRRRWDIGLSGLAYLGLAEGEGNQSVENTGNKKGDEHP